MGVLVFICPTSGHEVATGLEIDPASCKGLQKESSEIRCSDCGHTTISFKSRHDSLMIISKASSSRSTRQTQPVTATYGGRA